jgi:hypothetical protein
VAGQVRVRTPRERDRTQDADGTAAGALGRGGAAGAARQQSRVVTRQLGVCNVECTSASGRTRYCYCARTAWTASTCFRTDTLYDYCLRTCRRDTGPSCARSSGEKRTRPARVERMDSHTGAEAGGRAREDMRVSEPAHSRTHIHTHTFSFIDGDSELMADLA